MLVKNTNFQYCYESNNTQHEYYIFLYIKNNLEDFLPSITFIFTKTHTRKMTHVSSW